MTSLESLKTPEDYAHLFNADTQSLLSVLDAANTVRQRHWGNLVTIHRINNAQNGYCPEDCSYCAQSKLATTPIQSYGLKPDDEIINEAKQAYENGAYRYCLVLSGRGPTPTKINRLTYIIRRIKTLYPEREVCLSAGLLGHDMAVALKQAGLDRLNHNLNPTEDQYKTICTTHSYADRMNTLIAAQNAGLALCSGVIVGTGESSDDLIQLAFQLSALKVASIPVNFLIPIPDTPFEYYNFLTTDYCLRVLALFRLVNPEAEIRMAAGREYHLKSLQVMGLYAANSLFIDGYLNTAGSDYHDTVKLVQDAGFKIRGDQTPHPVSRSVSLKTETELRPTR